MNGNLKILLERFKNDKNKNISLIKEKKESTYKSSEMNSIPEKNVIKSNTEKTNEKSLEKNHLIGILNNYKNKKQILENTKFGSDSSIINIKNSYIFQESTTGAVTGTNNNKDLISNVNKFIHIQNHNQKIEVSTNSKVNLFRSNTYSVLQVDNIDPSASIKNSKTGSEIEILDEQEKLIRNTTNLNKIKNELDNLDLLKTISNRINEMKLNLIKEDVQTRINIKKLMHNLDNIISILQYMGGDLKGVFYSFKNFQQTIKNYLKANSMKVVEDFEFTYKNYFKVISKFIVIQLNQNSNKIIKADLIIVSKLIADNKFYGSSLIISEVSNYVGDKNLFKNIYKFDYQKKEKSKRIWLVKENVNFHYDEFKKSYVQPIMIFAHGDEIEISINLISERGFINFSSFKWIKMKFQNIPKIESIQFSQVHGSKEIAEFDLSRICELEIIKNKWFDIKLQPCSFVNKFVNDFNKSFSAFLKADKIFYDIQGYYLIRIFFISVKEGSCILLIYSLGLINLENYFGININIKAKNESLRNEIKKNCLVFDRCNKLQIRIGDELIFYITINK